jgi:hypothetical protein
VSDNLPVPALKVIRQIVSSDKHRYHTDKPDFTIKSRPPPGLDSPLESGKTSSPGAREWTRIKFTASKRSTGLRLSNGASICGTVREKPLPGMLVSTKISTKLYFLLIDFIKIPARHAGEHKDQHLKDLRF